MMAAGLLLLGISLTLVVRNEREVRAGGEQAELALARMQSEIQQRSDEGESTQAPEALPVMPAKELPVVEMNGWGYIGQLTIDALQLELPVMDQWSYGRLRTAPCRQLGTTAEQMVIAGHNYATHFGGLKNLKPGDLLSFTDMDGDTTRYTVETVRVVSPQDGELLRNDAWNLILYTCTYGGAKRVLVGCTLAVS